MFETGRICAWCGCTDARACPGGCAWARIDSGSHYGLCTVCEAEWDSIGRAWPEDRVMGDPCDDCDEPAACPRCWGEGEIVTCFDDLCIGQDWCMHGDGQEICPECHGTGEV